MTTYLQAGAAACQERDESSSVPSSKTEHAQVVAQVDGLIKEHFYRPDFDFDSWSQATAVHHRNARQATSNNAFAKALNQMLATLQASHTAYFGRNDPRRYQLLGVFARVFPNLPDESFCYPGVGVLVDPSQDPQFVLAVLDGFPAAAAGLRFGDRIEAVDGLPFHPVASFRGKEGMSVSLTVRRGEEIDHFDTEVTVLDGRTMFRSALESSIRVHQKDGWDIGYLHAWSYAGVEYHELIRETLLYGKLAECDAAVLDLRDGWGGADLNYLNLFREPIAIVTGQSRDGPARSYSGVWEKPICLLTNAGTTSGKELLAYGFKKLGLGKIVGETTAGAVLAGRIFKLDNGDVLYLAVQDIRVDGQILEGSGVAPDIEVHRKPENALDEPLEVGLTQLAEALQRSAEVTDAEAD